MPTDDLPVDEFGHVSSDTPVWYTFAVHLPFRLGLPDGDTILIGAPGQWRDPQAAEHFGPNPIIRIRLRNEPSGGVSMIRPEIAAALHALYGKQPLAADTPDIAGPEDAYEQWASLETQGALLDWENEDDQAFALHRCVYALNMFLTAHLAAFGDMEVHPVTTNELGPTLVYGAYTKGGEWHFIQMILMHPEGLPRFPEVDSSEGRFATVQEAMDYVRLEHPFVEPKLWLARARRAARRGDEVDRVVSLQTSMEGLLYATWRMILVDLGATESEIAANLTADSPFKTLVVTTLPKYLGGRWDVTTDGTAVGDYWSNLYLLRNRIVHGGYQPILPEGESADVAYLGMRTHVGERLWAKRRDFPRAMLARLGEPNMFGWKDPWVAEVSRKFDTESEPWWWPADKAGR